MSTTATSAPVRERSAITDQRRLGAVSVSAFALVAGLTVWFVASAIHDGENTGTVVGHSRRQLRLGLLLSGAEVLPARTSVGLRSPTTSSCRRHCSERLRRCLTDHDTTPLERRPRMSKTSRPTSRLGGTRTPSRCLDLRTRVPTSPSRPTCPPCRQVRAECPL